MGQHHDNCHRPHADIGGTTPPSRLRSSENYLLTLHTQPFKRLWRACPSNRAEQALARHLPCACVRNVNLPCTNSRILAFMS